jgi:hypothetical protein
VGERKGRWSPSATFIAAARASGGHSGSGEEGRWRWRGRRVSGSARVTPRGATRGERESFYKIKAPIIAI